MTIKQKGRKNMKKKSVAALCIVVLIAVALNYLAFFGVNIAGYKYDGIFDAQRGIRKGIDLAGGSVVSFEADAENPTDDDMNIVESIFQTRLTNAGYTEARISRGEAGKITVEIPSVFDTDSAASLLGSAAKLSFVDANGQVVLDGATDIKNASYRYEKLSEMSNPEPHVMVELTATGQEKFAVATKEAASRTDGTNFIAIVMDDAIISQPMVSEEINSDSCVISGNFTPESAQALANQIKSGQLPFDLNLISQETVGAELGEEALPKSLLAAGIGIIVILIFMVVIYRAAGIMADIALLVYIGLVSLVLGLARVNLSLSGIAGIVLSIGMAVDANVIIFERIKEELKIGKTIKASVEAGFKKAFSAILDSNITTIITCVVLYMSGIGAVTGFAITLGLGVVVSMFTAIVVTKFLLKNCVGLGIKSRKLFYAYKEKGGAE